METITQLVAFLGTLLIGAILGYNDKQTKDGIYKSVLFLCKENPSAYCAIKRSLLRS